MILLLMFIIPLFVYFGYLILRFLYVKSEKKREIRILSACILKEEEAGLNIPERTVQMLEELKKEYEKIRLLKRST